MLRDPFDHDVFVTYAGPDRALAEKVVDAWRAVELQEFIDVDLLPGGVWPSALPDSLERSGVLASLRFSRLS